jgi:leukotriene-A4 hydrolase
MQDTPSVKATYTASMTAPAGITVLMSAIRNTGPVAEGSRQRFTFKQPIPIQSYLIALAAGALESKQIGPRYCNPMHICSIL